MNAYRRGQNIIEMQRAFEWLAGTLPQLYDELGMDGTEEFLYPHEWTRQMELMFPPQSPRVTIRRFLEQGLEGTTPRSVARGMLYATFAYMALAGITTFAAALLGRLAVPGKPLYERAQERAMWRLFNVPVYGKTLHERLLSMELEGFVEIVQADPALLPATFLYVETGRTPKGRSFYKMMHRLLSSEALRLQRMTMREYARLAGYLIRWVLAPGHTEKLLKYPRFPDGRDICDEMAEREFGYGPGLYHPDDLSDEDCIVHPYCECIFVLVKP